MLVFIPPQPPPATGPETPPARQRYNHATMANPNNPIPNFDDDDNHYWDGPQYDSEPPSGFLSIHHAAQSGSRDQVVQALAANAALVNARDTEGNGVTPLMCVHMADEHIGVIDLLIERGADVTLRDSTGATAAHWAVSFDMAASLRKLLDAGTPLEVVDNNGATLLMACLDQHSAKPDDCLPLLLERYSAAALHLDTRDAEGRTALHYAVDSCYPQGVQMLLTAGADPTITDEQGRTPLRYASLNHQHHMRYNPEKAQQYADMGALLCAAVIARALHKARALLEASHTIDKARDEGESAAVQQQKGVAAAPAYLKGRVERNAPLPRVKLVVHHQEQLRATVAFVLGGVEEDDDDGSEEVKHLPRELFKELLGHLMHAWADKGPDAQQHG